MMQFILQTEDKNFYTITLNKFKELKTINNFFGWYCDRGFANASIGMLGEYRVSSCKNNQNEKICKQPMCWIGLDMSIPKAINKETLECFLNDVTNISADDLLEYSIDKGNIIAVSEIKAIKQNLYTVEWSVMQRCNYECSYCPPRLHSKITDIPSLEELKQRFIGLNVPTHKKLKVVLAGGEPTLVKELPELVKWLNNYSDIKTEVMLMTNGTSSIEKLKTLHSVCATMVISVHDEYMTDKVLVKWHDFIGESTSKNKIVFKYFEQSNYVEQIEEFLRYNNVRISKMPLVDKENITWLK